MLTDQLLKLATGATVALMFFSLAWLQPYLAQLSTTYLLAGTAASALIAVGVYRLLADGLLWLFKKSQWLRKIILGNGFIEGTWVGHYLHGTEHRFTLERIDQTSGVTIIRGREFGNDGKTRASWSSDTVSIDLARMQLVYAYTCKVFERKHVQEGLGVFSMVREVSGQPVNKLDGYAVDLIDGDRDPNTEIKISNQEVKDEDAIIEARRIFGVAAP